jgi:NitT/TauT family transport system substrate-binding protein
MALHRRSFLKLAGVAGTSSAFGISAPAIVRAATPIKLTLPWLPLGTFSFTFVAKKLGYWEKRGLDVTIDRGFGSTKVCVPVDQGQYDFGLLDMAVLAGCAGRGLDLVAIAGIWPRSPIGIFSLKELNITEPKQLEGQSIGFDVGGGEFQLWPAFVKATGIDAGKVNIVTMDAPGLMRAAADKQIKVIGNFFGSIAPTFWANRIAINAMFYEDYGVKMCSVVAACKRATVEKKPEICRSSMVFWRDSNSPTSTRKRRSICMSRASRNFRAARRPRVKSCSTDRRSARPWALFRPSRNTGSAPSIPSLPRSHGSRSRPIWGSRTSRRRRSSTPTSSSAR